MSKNTITEERISHLMETAEFEAMVSHEKCLILSARLENGFVITESSACVDPANFDQEIGIQNCYGRIRNKLWELEGYALQKELYEKAQKAKNRKPRTKKTKTE